jgi:hypothetical protein
VLVRFAFVLALLLLPFAAEAQMSFTRLDDGLGHTCREWLATDPDGIIRAHVFCNVPTIYHGTGQSQAIVFDPYVCFGGQYADCNKRRVTINEYQAEDFAIIGTNGAHAMMFLASPIGATGHEKNKAIKFAENYDPVTGSKTYVAGVFVNWCSADQGGCDQYPLGLPSNTLALFNYWLAKAYGIFDPATNIPICGLGTIPC